MAENLDITEVVKRMQAARDALTESINFMTTWQEAERRKHAAQQPDIQK